jgi:hypothetical protein
VAQTDINTNAAPILPNLPNSSGSKLSDIIITPDEVESVLKPLPIGKASGPDKINNKILSELSNELSGPLCSLFNYPTKCVKFLMLGKTQMSLHFSNPATLL